MQEIILVKLGGSIVTDKTKPYTLRKRVLKRLAKELTTSHCPLIVSHGAGSFAHTSAQKYGGMHGYTEKLGLATVAKDALFLNTIVVDALIQAGIPALPFRSLNTLITNNGNVQEHFFAPLVEALQQGFTPVVYGDVILDTSWKSTIYSGEKILGVLAKYLKRQGFMVQKIIEVTNTYGVYNAERKTIPQISYDNWEEVKQALHQTAHDVSGGMKHKVDQALLLTKENIHTHIINGLYADELQKALQNIPMKGTCVTV